MDKDHDFIHELLFFPKLIATLVFLLIYSFIVGMLYSSTKKLEIIVTSEKVNKISEHFNDLNYYRLHTIIEAIGDYSKKKLHLLQMIINIEELDDVTEDILKIDSNALVNVKKIKAVYDIYDWTPQTKYD